MATASPPASPVNAATFAPGAIAAPGIAGGPALNLAMPAWLEIQVYVSNALALPTDADQLRRFLGPAAPANMSSFGDLIQAYAAISGHCQQWLDTTFPRTVSLAGDIANYGSTKAPAYYPTILKEADVLVGDPQNVAAKSALRGILRTLRDAAAGCADKARAAATEVQGFVEQCQADEEVLVGPDGDGGLYHTYDKRCGSASEAVHELQREIATQRQVLADANAEYNRDVTIAAATATYAWVPPPVGLVAAAVVAGIYGQRAVDALRAMNAAQDKIAADQAELAVMMNTMQALDIGRDSLGGLKQQLAVALPALERVHGVWSGMTDSLTQVIATIDDNVSAVAPMIMSVGVNEALREWHTVALAADAYRTRAYVQQTGDPTQTMLGWKVSTMMASGQSR